VLAVSVWIIHIPRDPQQQTHMYSQVPTEIRPMPHIDNHLLAVRVKHMVRASVIHIVYI